MGREVRRVPADWQHPKGDDGSYIPLHGGSFGARAAKWDEGNTKWHQGLRSDYKGGWLPIDLSRETFPHYEDWAGVRPDPREYMPDWPEEQRTHYQMYETVSEGTPISPPLPSPEALARWLADNGANAGARTTATYEQWLETIRVGSAPSMVLTGGRLLSGVAAMTELRDNRR